MSQPLTPSELAAERAEWKRRERARRQARDEKRKREKEHPWRKFRAGPARIGWDDEYVPVGYTATGERRP